jgi:hypothetical protein
MHDQGRVIQYGPVSLKVRPPKADFPGRFSSFVSLARFDWEGGWAVVAQPTATAANAPNARRLHGVFAEISLG